MKANVLLPVFLLSLLFLSCEKKDSSLPAKTDEPVSAAPMGQEPGREGDNGIDLSRPPRQNRKGSAEMAFFYRETCPSCDDYLMARSIAERVETGAKQGWFPWTTVRFTSTNILTQQQVDELDAFIGSHDLPDVSLSLPLFFVNGEIVVGYEEINLLVDGLLKE